MFWLVYSFHSDGEIGVLYGIFFSFRWRTWYFGWRIVFFIKMAYMVVWLAYSFHSYGGLGVLVSVFLYWNGQLGVF